MDNDEWRFLKDYFDSTMRRAKDSGLIGLATFKGLTWGMVAQGKSPTQVKTDIENLAKQLEAEEAKANFRRILQRGLDN